MDYVESIQTAQQLEEIREQMVELLDQARRVLRGTDRAIESRAESYWLAHIESALGRSHRGMCTMQDTINELIGVEGEEE